MISKRVFLSLISLLFLIGCGDREAERRAREEAERRAREVVERRAREVAERRAIVQTLQTARQLNNGMNNARRAVAALDVDRLGTLWDELKENTKPLELDKCPEDFRICAKAYFDAEHKVISNLHEYVVEMIDRVQYSSTQEKGIAVLLVISKMSNSFDKESSVAKMKYKEMLDCAELHNVNTYNFIKTE